MLALDGRPRFLFLESTSSGTWSFSATSGAADFEGSTRFFLDALSAWDSFGIVAEGLPRFLLALPDSESYIDVSLGYNYNRKTVYFTIIINSPCE